MAQRLTFLNWRYRNPQRRIPFSATLRSRLREEIGRASVIYVTRLWSRGTRLSCCHSRRIQREDDVVGASSLDVSHLRDRSSEKRKVKRVVLFLLSLSNWLSTRKLVHLECLLSLAFFSRSFIPRETIAVLFVISFILLFTPMYLSDDMHYYIFSINV